MQQQLLQTLVKVVQQWMGRRRSATKRGPDSECVAESDLWDESPESIRKTTPRWRPD